MLTMEDMLAIVKPHNDKLIAEGRIAELVAVLREVEPFLDDQADADDGRPNDAMRLLIEVRAAITKTESLASQSTR